MNSFASIIEAFGGGAKYGRAVGISDCHARVMKTRDSIPAEYWQDTVEAAERLGIDGVTFELLACLAARQRRGGMAA